MPDDNGQDPNPTDGEGQENQDKSISDAAKAILDEVHKNIDKASQAPDPTPPSSQPAPDPQAAYAARREEVKKKMGWTEEQMQFHEQEKMAAVAPVAQEIAFMKVERTHKDFDQLRKPFMEEVSKYQKAGRVIDSDLAEQIFFMIKGREIEAGRYQLTPPSSQPAPVPPQGRSPSSAAPVGAAGRMVRRIAAGYSGSEPSLSGGKGEGQEEVELSDREKTYARVLNVDAKDYKKMKDDRDAGVREIGEHAIKAPEIDTRSANPADRDLASLWSRNGGRI